MTINAGRDNRVPGAAAQADMERAMAARMLILRGEGATAEEGLTATLDSADRFRILPETLSRAGWVRDVSDVLLDGDPVEHLYAPARQVLYFLEGKTGSLAFTAKSFGAIVSGSVALADESLVSLRPHIASASAVTMDTVPLAFRFNAAGQYIFTLHDFTAEEGALYSELNPYSLNLWADMLHPDGSISRLYVADFTGHSLDLSTLWGVVTEVKADGQVVAFTQDGSTITLEAAVDDAELQITAAFPGGEWIVHVARGVTGLEYELPGSVEAVYSAFFNEYWGFAGYAPYTDFDAESQILYLGDMLEGEALVVEAETEDGVAMVFTVADPDGNGMAFPAYLAEITALTLDAAALPIIFDYYTQSLALIGAISGELSLTVTVQPYLGLAQGGEELLITAEIPGLMATSAGTGEPWSTVRGDPDKAVDTAELVAVLDDEYTYLYFDETDLAQAFIADGFIDPQLAPITPKLPLAPLWEMSRRDDRSFFSQRLTPDYGFTHPVSFYTGIEDTLRVGDGSVAPGASVRMSYGTVRPVRGVNGVQVAGATPTYYGGRMHNAQILSLYKWFLAEVAAVGDNTRLSLGQSVLLCIQNTSASAVIQCSIYESGGDVAADIFALKEA